MKMLSFIIFVLIVMDARADYSFVNPNDYVQQQQNYQYQQQEYQRQQAEALRQMEQQVDYAEQIRQQQELNQRQQYGYPVQGYNF